MGRRPSDGACRRINGIGKIGGIRFYGLGDNEGNEQGTLQEGRETYKVVILGQSLVYRAFRFQQRVVREQKNKKVKRDSSRTSQRERPGTCGNAWR